jgi:hypothetical protein
LLAAWYGLQLMHQAAHFSDNSTRKENPEQLPKQTQEKRIPSLSGL